jgi:hypothetical protein
MTAFYVDCGDFLMCQRRFQTQLFSLQFYHKRLRSVSSTVVVDPQNVLYPCGSRSSNLSVRKPTFPTHELEYLLISELVGKQMMQLVTRTRSPTMGVTSSALPSQPMMSRQVSYNS